MEKEWKARTWICSACESGMLDGPCTLKADCDEAPKTCPWDADVPPIVKWVEKP